MRSPLLVSSRAPGQGGSFLVRLGWFRCLIVSYLTIHFGSLNLPLEAERLARPTVDAPSPGNRIRGKSADLSAIIISSRGSPVTSKEGVDHVWNPTHPYTHHPFGGLAGLWREPPARDRAGHGEAISEFRKGTKEMTENLVEEAKKTPDTAGPGPTPTPPASPTAKGNFCNQCGTANPPEARFCSNCGSQLPPQAA